MNLQLLRNRLNKHPIGLLTVFLLLFMWLPTSMFADIRYRQTEIVTEEEAYRDTKVVAADLFGDQSKEILIIDLKTRRMETYFLSGGRYEGLKVALPEPAEKASLIYLLRLAGNRKYSLAYIVGRSMYHFREGTAGLETQPTFLLDMPTTPTVSENIYASLLPLNIDLNNDGLDEILYPEGDRIAFLTPNSEGSFDRRFFPTGLSVYELNFFNIDEAFLYRWTEMEDLHHTYIAPHIEFVMKDVNNDNLLDVLYLWLDEYLIFFQKPDLYFSEDPDVTFEVKPIHNYSQNIADINLDGIPDMVTTKSSFDVMSPMSDVEIMYGEVKRTQPREIEFKTIKTYRHKDPIGITYMADFNGDQRLDLASTYFSYNFASAEELVDYLYGKHLRFKIRYYLQSENNTFSTIPSYEIELTILKDYVYESLDSILCNKDIDGDGWCEFFITNGKDQCRIYLFNKKKRQFSKKPIELQLEQNGYQGLSHTLTDLNNDGIKDLLVRKRGEKNEIVLEIFLSEK